MRWKTTIAIGALLVCGAALLRYSAMDSGWLNWYPIQMPMPLAQATIRDSFRVQRGGRFELQIVTVAMGPFDEGPPLPADFSYKISQGNRFVISRTAHHVKLSSSGQFDTFAPDNDIIMLPAGGEYDFELETRSLPASFCNRGAMLQMERLSPSIGLEYPIETTLGYCCFAAVLIVFVLRDARA
jgi:hypothetical protein